MKRGAGSSSKGAIAEPKLESRALAKGLELMEILASAGRPMPLGELARAVGLGKPSALRLLHTLSDTGFATRSDGGEYALNRPWVQSTTQDWLQGLITAATPEMERLNADLAETVSMAALFEDHVRVIHVIESPRHIRMSNYCDRILPPYASSLGKAIAAFQAPDRVQALLNVYGIYSFTSHTITEPLLIREELIHVRERGYASETEETVDGACCFAAPIHTSEEPVRAALSVSLPMIRFTDVLQEQLPKILLEAAKKVELALKRGRK